MIKFVSSNWFAAKSVEQMRVEQSQFEQFTPTQKIIIKPATFPINNFFLSRYFLSWKIYCCLTAGCLFEINYKYVKYFR